MRNLRVVFFVFWFLVCPVTIWAADCQPKFSSISTNRFLPTLYVRQGLESIPHLFPKHSILLQRELSHIANVDYSLLVYKEDTTADIVTIEGAAVRDAEAWSFRLQCPSDRMLEGLIATLEKIASLGKK